jgi:hypothetical protein
MCSFSNKWASKWQTSTHTHTPFAELHQLAKSLVLIHKLVINSSQKKMYVKSSYMDAKSFPCGANKQLIKVVHKVVGP